MNESTPKSRAAGDPVYVSAHGITVNEGALPFEEAYALASLVIRERGGPSKIGGRYGMPKGQAKRLQKLGYVAICGEGSQIEVPTVTIHRTPSEELGDGSTHAFKIHQHLAVGLRIWVIATHEGVDLVERNQSPTRS